MVDDTTFMEAVRTYRTLWDRACTDFKDKHKKTNAWKEVATQCGLDISVAEKRYSTIRSSFGRYLASIRPPSGSGRESIELDSKWEHLRWLMPFIKHRPGTTSNLNVDISKPKSVCQSVILSETESQSSVTVTQKENEGSLASTSYCMGASSSNHSEALNDSLNLTSDTLECSADSQDNFSQSESSPGIYSCSVGLLWLSCLLITIY